MSNGHLTPEANTMLHYMIGKLSSCKYIYRSIASGCYDVGINDGLVVPFESKDEILDEFFRIMNEINE